MLELQRLQEIAEEYDSRDDLISSVDAMEMMDGNERNDYFMLLQIADSLTMGKTFSILTAFKLGFNAGKAS